MILSSRYAAYDCPLRILERSQDPPGFIQRQHHAGRLAGTNAETQQEWKQFCELVLHPRALVHPVQCGAPIPGQREEEGAVSV